MRAEAGLPREVVLNQPQPPKDSTDETKCM